MKRLILSVSLMLFGCGGSDAGGVFEQQESDSAAVGEDTGATGEETTPGADTTPGEDDAVTPPVDSGGPPVIDSGATDSGSTTPDLGLPEAPPTPVTCTEPSGKMYMGHCYFPLMPRTWSAARDFCLSLKAHLVTITSAGEQAHVETILFNDRWIGLARAEGTASTSSSYKWITGEALGYTRWDDGEPNGSGLCVRMKGSGDGRWADLTCTQNLGAVCERE